MNPFTEPSDEELCQRWRQGDETAARMMYSRFTGQLLNLIQNRLANRVKSRVDPDSVMHSVMKSLLLRTSQGQFEFAEDGDVWRLLVTMSLNKVRNRVRDAQAAIRDVRREAPASTLEFDVGLAQRLASGPDDEETIVFADLIDSLLKQLDPLNQEIVRLRLEGLKPEEIGPRLSSPMTSRSVNRRLSGEIFKATQSLLNPE